MTEHWKNTDLNDIVDEEWAEIRKKRVFKGYALKRRLSNQEPAHV